MAVEAKFQRGVQNAEDLSFTVFATRVDVLDVVAQIVYIEFFTYQNPKRGGAPPSC